MKIRRAPSSSAPLSADGAKQRTLAPDLLTTLHQKFGFDSFRPGQETAIRRVLAGQHTLLVMPTGSGKSLAYQLPALLLPGLTLIISPLIALMKDQVDTLLEAELPATYINSSLPSKEQTRRLRAMREGYVKLVYVAPERLRSNRFVRALTNVPVSLMAVDEAHCVSQWGHDFRPDYLKIRPAWEGLGHPPLLATTATATPQVQSDILRLLGPADAECIVTGFNRPNLFFEVHHAATEASKLGALRQLLQSSHRQDNSPGILDLPPDAASDHEESAAGAGSVLIYVATRLAAEEVAAFIRDAVGLRAEAYHAGLDPNMRHRVQNAFMGDQLPVVVATNAFGMGIDKPDIRAVIHYQIPATVEAYYQEAGRAGRDGLPARCVLFFSPDDVSIQTWFIDADTPSLDDLRAVHRLAGRGAQDGETLISLDELADITGLHPVKVRVALSELEQAGMLLHLGDEAGYSRWRLLSKRERGLEQCAKAIADRAEHRHQLLNKMIAYAESDACHRRYLLDYFGDDSLLTDHDVPPACCDNCQASVKAADLPAAKSAEDWIPLIVLETVRTLPRPVGRVRLAQILRGSRARAILGMGYERHKFYSKLAHLRQERITTITDSLVEARYLALSADRRPVLTVTPTGLAALKARAAIPLLFQVPHAPDQAATKRKERPAVHEGLFEALRQWRKAQAGKQEMPPYLIFHDRVLRAIAASLPTDPEALRNISGVGPAKLEKYGHAVLAIVQAHLTDSLRAPAPPTPAPKQDTHAAMPPPEPRAVILAAVADLSGLLSRSGLAKLLAGSPSVRVAPYRDHPLYGKLHASWSLQELTAEIDRLITEGRLIDQQGRLALSSGSQAQAQDASA